MYTWGYIKDASLVKLDITSEEGTNEGVIAKFPYYANEVITQVCSGVKPKYTFYDFYVSDKSTVFNKLKLKYNVFLDKMYDDELIATTETEQNFLNDYNSYNYVNEDIKMPSDFVSFGSDVCSCYDDNALYECTDEDFSYRGFNSIRCYHTGKYSISYNARWITFSPSTDDNEVLDVPEDILDCIPSYIAHQCLKTDDEYKSAVFANEYEKFVARIDNSQYNSTGTIHIGGGW